MIVGAGGHGKVVAEAAELSGFRHIVFVDDRYPELKTVGRWAVLGKANSEALKTSAADYFVVAVGDNTLRLGLHNGLRDSGFEPLSIIHPRAVVSVSAKLGQGSVVFANAVINADATVGEACIINTSAVVEHDCVLQEGVHVSPGVNLGGGVVVGRCSWLGIGATVIPYKIIGTKVVVGAGGVVVTDLPDGVIAKGVPARYIYE